MSNQLKKKNTAGGGLYIALAICVLSVICIGVYSAVINILEPTGVKNPSSEQNVVEKKEPSKVIEVPKGTSPSVTTAPPVTTTVPAPTEKAPEISVQVTPTAPTYTMPVAGDVTKAFSHDVLVYSETMNDYRVHNGADIQAAVGTPVKAVTGGVVEAIYEDPLMGFTVSLDHGNGTKSLYSNLSSAFPEGLEVGKSVKEGEIIGGVGESNLIECAEEPHLHFEVVVNGEHVDPMSYFQ